MDVGLAYEGAARYLDEFVERLEAEGATVRWERPEIPSWDDYGQTHVQADLQVATDEAAIHRVVSGFREYYPSARIGVGQPT